MRISMRMARRISQQVKPAARWEDVHDAIDILTGGELENHQLNMLSDWVWKILQSRSH